MLLSVTFRVLAVMTFTAVTISAAATPVADIERNVARAPLVISATEQVRNTERGNMDRRHKTRGPLRFDVEDNKAALPDKRSDRIPEDSRLAIRAPLFGGGGDSDDTGEESSDGAQSWHAVTITVRGSLADAPAGCCQFPGDRGFAYASPSSYAQCRGDAAVRIGNQTLPFQFTHHDLTEPSGVWIDFLGAERFGLPQKDATYEGYGSW